MAAAPSGVPTTKGWIPITTAVASAGRFGAGLGGKFQNVVEPQRLDLPRPLHPRELLAHVDGDHRIGQ